MNKCIKTLLVASCLLATAQAQTKMSRAEIFDNWGKLELTTQTGTKRVLWLPNGLGYLENEVDDQAKNRTFFKVDPRNGERTPLFDGETTAAMIADYNKLTGQAVTGLPFQRFDYLADNSGIRFKVKDMGAFLFRFDSGMVQLPAPRSKLAGWKPHRTSRQLEEGSYAPDLSRIAYVKDYDIYMLDAATNKEERLTQNGTASVMNGRTDWVYPEETGQADAFWWSPDGKKMAFLQFDVEGEFIYPMLHEINLDVKDGSEHYRFETVLEKQRYPKAGETNATVKLFILDLETRALTEVPTNSSPDVYILKCQWRRDSSELTFQRLNRFQNKLELLAANAKDGSVRTILVEEEEGFVELHNNFRMLENGSQFLWTSERSGWNHLYLYDFTGKQLAQLTQGEWEVAGIRAIDEKKGRLFFTANMDNGLESHFCRVQLDGSGFQQLTKSGYSHRVAIDPAGIWYTDQYSSLTQPPVVDMFDADGQFIRNLSTTRLNQAKFDELGLSLPELVKFKANDGKTVLHSILYKPAQYDPNKQYPLVVSVYGGPAGGVRNAFQLFWLKRAQLGYFLVKQDNRGTTHRGKQYLTETYLKFGIVEIDDQAAGVKQLTQRPYIDGSRVGITGGSYGGYASCMALLRYPDVFQVGVAMSSVTDWRSYDTIYTERYMRTPQANPEGYRLSSTMTYAENLKGKLMLVHGLVDNNVHVGNTLHLADALQKAGKQFDMMIYPENRHGIRGYHGRHLGRLAQDYMLKHLKPEGWQARLDATWAEPTVASPASTH